MNDFTDSFRQIVAEKISTKTALKLTGNETKAFYGRKINGEKIALQKHSGIIRYEPKELFVTARGGTLLSDLENILAKEGQMLAFEPPHFGKKATLAGTIACGFSGPRRPFTGAARDFVLGVRIINGKANILRFGGEVMKNVAGYDLSRLVTGSMGTFGIILDVSIKLLPLPKQEITLFQEQSPERAITLMNEWSAKSLPLSAACYDGEKLYIRLSSGTHIIKAIRKKIGGELLDKQADFWSKLKEHKLDFFLAKENLWRISLPSNSKYLKLQGKQFIDWAGAQIWLRSNQDGKIIRDIVAGSGGFATLFRGERKNKRVFQPLPPLMMDLQRKLKLSFDPQNIFNPGIIYKDI